MKNAILACVNSSAYKNKSPPKDSSPCLNESGGSRQKVAVQKPLSFCWQYDRCAAGQMGRRGHSAAAYPVFFLIGLSRAERVSRKSIRECSREYRSRGEEGSPGIAAGRPITHAQCGGTHAATRVGHSRRDDASDKLSCDLDVVRARTPLHVQFIGYVRFLSTQ